MIVNDNHQIIYNILELTSVPQVKLPA